jgi:chromosome partitioning protein
MRRVVFNQKGGVGKSTIVCNLAAINASHGRSTAVIDLDPQGNSSQYLLGEDWNQEETNIARYFEQSLSFRLAESDPAEFCVETPFSDLWIMPASMALHELQPKLESKHKIYKLREALEKLENEVDDIYIDTPPAFNFYTLSALIAAQGCLIPFDCDEFARKALYQLLDNVAETQTDHNPELHVEGIVVNQFQARSRLPRRMVEELKAEEMPVLEQAISSSVVVKESHEACKPLIYYRRSHKVTREFEALHQALPGG